jgi:hypothetical protein
MRLSKHFGWCARWAKFDGTKLPFRREHTGTQNSDLKPRRKEQRTQSKMQSKEIPKEL